MTYDPHYPQYAPQPPRKKNGGKIAGLGCLGVFLLALIGGCVASSTDDPTDTPSTPAVTGTTELVSTPTPTFSLDQRTLTELSVGIAWDAFGETDKDDMCSGVTLFGTDWAARQMQAGGGGDNLDWDYAAEIIQDKCASRS